MQDGKKRQRTFPFAAALATVAVIVVTAALTFFYGENVSQYATEQWTAFRTNSSDQSATSGTQQAPSGIRTGRNGLPSPSGYVDRVIDGDSIVVAGEEIRLNGIAAPEWNEPGGGEVERYLEGLVGDRRLDCRGIERDRYSRLVARCWLGNGTEVNAELVKAGVARDCPRYSSGRYARFEDQRHQELPLPAYCRR